jgi:hypothetical protein
LAEVLSALHAFLTGWIFTFCDGETYEKGWLLNAQPAVFSKHRTNKPFPQSNKQPVHSGKEHSEL